VWVVVAVGAAVWLLCGPIERKIENSPKDTIRMNDFVAKLVLSWGVHVLCSDAVEYILIIFVYVYLDVDCVS
jgi:hypothetical protein